MKVFHKTRTLLRQIYVLLLLLLFPQHYEAWIAGSVLIVSGVIIHFWASGYLLKEKQLITAGPYKFVRNPFYVANFIIDTGITLIFALCLDIFNCKHIYLWGIVVIYFVVFYGYVITRRVKKEEEFLRQQFAQEYESYCQKVPRFIPSFSSKITSPYGRFSAENLKRNKEIPRALNMLLLIPLGLLVYDIKQSGLVFSMQHFVVAGVILVGYLCALVMRFLHNKK